MTERITRDHVIWAYRLLLDRDPEGDEAILPKLRAWTTTRELRVDVMASEEFRLKNPDHAAAAASAIVIKPLPGGGRLFLDLADHVISLGILRDGYEQEALQFAMRLVRTGQTVIDVGAHVGFFTIHLAPLVGPAGRVYAFEPLARNADLLDASIRESRFDDRVVLQRAAVSDKSGAATLRYAEETLNTGGAFLSERAPPGLEALRAVQVPTVRLDDLDLSRPVRLMKVDVEGAEPAVFAGARDLIAADRPVIISEVHPEQLRLVSQVTPGQLFEQLAALGLRPHRIKAEGLGPPIAAEQVRGVITVAFADGSVLP
jgi:FkbM family methyltransferase